MDDSVKDSQIESILLRNETLVYKTRGVSMEPMLRQNRDLVVVRAPASRLKKYDVALYKRGETHVLHRVIAVKEGHYLIRGDNTYALENVPDSAVIGVLVGFQRKGKTINVENRGYRLYVRFWDAIYPLRVLHFRSRRLAVGVARELGVLPLIKKAAEEGNMMRYEPGKRTEENVTINKTAQDVIYLASCAVNETMPDPERVAAMDLDAVYRLARWQSLAATLAPALEAAAMQDNARHGLCDGRGFEDGHGGV